MIFSIEEKKADAPAICSSDGVTVTYRQLKECIEHMRSIFCDRCLIFCMCENAPGAVLGYLSALENRVVPLLLGADLKQEQFGAFYHVYEPAYVWAPLEWKGRSWCHVCDKVYEAYGYGLYKTEYQPYPMHGALGLLLATSGSTGNPKLVRLSRENVEANAQSIREYLHLDENERPITTLPMQYTYGLSIINSHLLAGACILMTKESYVQKGFWEFFRERSATSFGGVPYTYEILKRLRIFKGELPSLTSMTQAGGRLSKALQKEVGEWAKAHNVRFVVMYGQTEATARMSYLPPEKCLYKLGSIGIPVPGGSFYLLDDDGTVISGAGQTGELIYEGRNVSLGYAKKKEDLRAGDQNKGVLHTGDMAYVDEDGCYYVTGRRKRFIKIFGVRVGLDACEQILRDRFEDVEFACTGTDDRMKIYGTERTAVCEAAAYLAAYLGLNKKGFLAFYLPEIPKNDSGKTQYTQLQKWNPFQMKKEQKDAYMTRELCGLTDYHRKHCKSYGAMLDALGYEAGQITHYRDLPFLPVTLFKELTLTSLDAGQEDFKTVTSSGTGGQIKSRIILDADTRTAQQKALASIGSDFLGTNRMPMLVIDSPATVRQRDHFSARTSGIQGFSLFGTRRTFALKDDMTLDREAVMEFLQKYGRNPFLIFGFTFMVWRYFCLEIERQGLQYDCSQGILVHGGGWKKLIREAVSKKEFKERLQHVCGIRRVIDYYGMAEQTGSIFMECECGHLHCSDYSAILFRRAEDFSVCDMGEKGLIQVMSLLPKSYPGHNLLTEDEGRLLGVDDCPCGRAGAYFEVLGRVQNAELRGCSDTYAAEI